MNNDAKIFSLAGACDCHLHVVGPKSNYPLSGHRVFTPMDARLDQLLMMHQRLGVERLVLIQTSVFGHDNSCLLDSLKLLGPRARGIVMLPENTPAETLDEMDKVGVRGIRVNIATFGSCAVEKIADRLKEAAAMAARNGWHVQLFTFADAIPALEPILETLPTPVSVDHFGLIPRQEKEHPAEVVLKRLLAKGKLWVKISGAYRLDDDGSNDISDPRIGALAQRLYKANPERIVWGTDWPHTPFHGHDLVKGAEVPYRDIDTGSLLLELNRWFEDADARKRILVENPKELYRF